MMITILKRQFLVAVLLSLTSALVASAATVPLYVNTSPVHITMRPQVAPQIDATAFVNRSEFEIDDIYGSGLPYHTLNTLFFTNTSSGMIWGFPGYRFDFFTNNTRLSMNTWVNQNSISGDTWVLVTSTNILS